MLIGTAVLANLGIIYTTLVFSPIQAKSVTPQYEKCDGLPNLPTNYTREELVTVGKHIYDIAISHHTGNIYIAYMKWPMLVLKRSENKIKPIVGIYDVILSVAVMYSAPKVYIGCATKVKMYHEITGRISNILIIPYGLQKIFIHRGTSDLYAVRKSDSSVYTYRNQLSKTVKVNIQVLGSDLNRFVVDGQGNFYYTTEENERNVTKTMSKELNSTPVTYKEGIFYNLAVDNGGRVFGTANSSLYHLRSDESEPQFVTALGFEPCRMCFDKYNNIVFGTKDEKIIILKHNNECALSLPPETNNTIVISNITQNTLNNSQNEFDYNRPESNGTIELDVNMYDVLMREIKSLKENQKSLIMKYNDVILKINNTAEGIHKKLDKINKTKLGLSGNETLDL